MRIFAPMSKQQVENFITLLEDPVHLEAAGLDDPEPAEVIAAAERDHGLRFSEADLRSALNTRICNAESLPRPWGWPLARKLGLVRS